MVAAGLVLDVVQFWPCFTEVGVMIMVPALLGLKGNLGKGPFNYHLFLNGLVH